MSKIKITKQIREFIKSDNKLSANARLFYLLLADRADLSEKNKETFSDEHGIFVYYPLSEIQDDIHCSEKTAIKILVELSDAGLIERRHTQRADKIYVLQTTKFRECRPQNLGSANPKNYGVQTTKFRDNQNPTKQKPINQENKSSSSSTPPQKISDEQIK
ncbi:MAG: replication initiator protein A, partial [Clostridia bacterium]|nr:replication initiator protein A [Clostridia bacterium]